MKFCSFSSQTIRNEMIVRNRIKVRNVKYHGLVQTHLSKANMYIVYIYMYIYTYVICIRIHIWIWCIVHGVVQTSCRVDTKVKQLASILPDSLSPTIGNRSRCHCSCVHLYLSIYILKYNGMLIAITWGLNHVCNQKCIRNFSMHIVSALFISFFLMQTATFGLCKTCSRST